MIQTPKQRFLARKTLAAEHNQRCQDQNFISTVDFALLHYIEQQSRIPQAPDAVATGYRIEGARDFVRILMSLSDEPTRAEPLPDGNLVGNVRLK